MQGLSFEQALERGDVVLAGVKDVLEVYGFSIDGLLASVQARTVKQSGDSATVEISYSLLGVRNTHQAEMVRVADRWVVRHGRSGPQGELKSGLGG